ncbi:putative acetyltransferase [Streptomyces griseoaurantiacus M045]|uniref:Putative acetyltransferase n=1 Tax=Streptomyces griseoaurantiacus M045 TaxID=996637 RepID=F3NEW8_9ACTN|nr:putative acetyltransferase [Streptomyces griseoaurantiacus M045]
MPAGEVWPSARWRPSPTGPSTVLAADGLEHLELLHQVDNRASCRVAHKSRYVLDTVLPAAPPSCPGEGHLHVRRREA